MPNALRKHDEMVGPIGRIDRWDAEQMDMFENN